MHHNQWGWCSNKTSHNKEKPRSRWIPCQCFSRCRNRKTHSMGPDLWYLILKPNRDIIGKKTMDHFLWWTHKCSQLKFLEIEFENTSRNSYYNDQVDLIQGNDVGSIHMNGHRSVIQYINILNNRNHTIICQSEKKSLWQSSTLIHGKNLKETRDRKNTSERNKGCLWQTHSQHYTKWE